MRARLQLGPGERSAIPVLVFLLIGFAAPLIAVIWFGFMPPRTFSLAAPAYLETTPPSSRHELYLLPLVAGLALTVSLLADLLSVASAWVGVQQMGDAADAAVHHSVVRLENIRLYGWVVPDQNGVLLGSLKSVFGIEMDSMLFTRTAIVLGMVYVYLPFMLFPMTLGISMVPDETRDAAYDLGASRWQVFKEVELPLSMPGIVIGFLLTFVLAVGAIAEAKVVGGQRIIPITHDIEIAFTYSQNWPLGAALSVLLMLVVGVLVLVALRRFDLDRFLGRK
jgi:spermidine/putrescine transport system permease protein